jgi:hypothetical protein
MAKKSVERRVRLDAPSERSNVGQVVLWNAPYLLGYQIAGNQV